MLPLAFFCVLPVFAVRPAQAQTFSVIHNFTDGADGAVPMAPLTFDQSGNLYGATYNGGGVLGRDCNPRTAGCGVAFKLMPHNGGWVFDPLFAFDDFDGAGPEAPVIFGPGNLLYGSTGGGGNDLNCNEGFYGCGVVFTLRPPPTACHSALCDWTENPIYTFATQTDGLEPIGNIAFDQAGNLYGATYLGGTGTCTSTGCGTVFQLTQSGSNWTKTTIHDFSGYPSDGFLPYGGVIIDSSDNLYGTTQAGGFYNYGTVFELTPSGSGWTETTLYTFQDGTDGAAPSGGLVMDAEGNLYGTAGGGGTGHGGTVFELSPSNGGYTFSVLASPPGFGGSVGSLAFDRAGNLYGTTANDGTHGCGNVFKLTNSGGQWTYSDLYDFTCGDDGSYPYAGPTLDSSGNIYGTTRYGGAFGDGVVWEITP